jgi:hypothetical protein
MASVGEVTTGLGEITCKPEITIVSQGTEKYSEVLVFHY